MSSCWVRVGGVDGYSIGSHTAPTWETLADGGCGQANLAFSTSSRVPHRALRKGVRFEILYGSQPVYTGITTEFDRQGGELNAKGLGLWLYDFLALDALGANTRNIGTALTQAMTRGWFGTNPLAITGTPDGSATGNPITIGALLDQYVEQTGQRWGCDGAGRLHYTTVPAEPKWLAAPDAAAFGETSDSSPTFLAGRYVDAGGVNQTATAGVAGQEGDVDLTDRSTLTLGQAQGILAGMLTRKVGTSWVNAVDLSSDQITTVGGTPGFLPMIRGGDLMRSFGVGYLAQGTFALSTVIGKTTYTAGAPTMAVEPVNTEPRTLTGVLAS